MPIHRSSSSQQRSVRRRKSEGTGLRIPRTDQGGLDPVSIPAKSFSRGSKAGIETSVDQLKVSDARTRRISDSGLSTSSSKLSGAALAEKFAGFAQTVRGLSRSSFSPGHSSPTMSSNSTCSTLTSPGLTPMGGSIDLGNSPGFACGSRNGSRDKVYESWDEFIDQYRKGISPPDIPLPKPRTGEEFPPNPSYIAPHEHLSYLAPPLPLNEEQRLRVLHSFQILQTGIDANFERIVQLVATVMGAKRCLVTLVDHLQVTVKAQHPSGYAECPRQQSLCGHTILRSPDDPLIVLDAQADWRFKDFPTVASEPYIRFYAGAPLTTSEGLNIGALCLMDLEPRAVFTEKERRLLVEFASVVMREMELWNDQVQLCLKNRMMRDVSRWLRGCLNTIQPEWAAIDEPPTHYFQQKQPLPLDPAHQPHPTPSDISTSSCGILTSSPVIDLDERPALITSPLLKPVFPTPTGSPTLPFNAIATAAASTPAPHPSPTVESSTTPAAATGNPVQDKSFPAACILIQATLNVDAVYLVQATANQTVIPPSGSSVVWNYLDAAGRRKGSVGVVRGGRLLNGTPTTSLACLASSQKNARTAARPVFDEKEQHTKRQGSAWVCTDESCRRHLLGDALLNAVEPVWERDMPIIKEMLGYVRQEIPMSPEKADRLFSRTQGLDVIENDWFCDSVDPTLFTDPCRRKLLCHTFQGTLPELAAGSTTPYQSSLIAPILGPSSSHGTQADSEPWAYLVILSSSRTKMFSFHERIYLKNFGSCLVTEVMKRRVEAADRAKGTFIRSISHELRTPLHIILGILELLYANPEEPLSDTQMEMISSAEASGKNLIDTINNIIDLAKLDPDNDMEAEHIHSESTSTPSPEVEVPDMEDVDIRDLCQTVADSMAKACTDKNVVVVPSWSKPSLSSLSSSSSNSATGSTTNVSIPNGYATSIDSLSSFTARKFRSTRRTVLELMVAMDEPEKDPDLDTQWNFSMDVKSMTRILTQLVENAIKFTTAGFVEISAVALTNSPIPMKPPHPDAHPILFTVRDTGKGISSEFVQSHLFKRFSQEDPLQVGTGLGLALVKELVRKLGGWMEVWSEGIEGKGCVVKILVWASFAPHQTKSLKDISGPWQETSCRFYAGEPSVGTDRLFKIMGERMMGQQLNMNVERGDESDVSPEDMLKNLNDDSPCDLLVINDDVIRLKTYLSYWSDYHRAAMADGVEDPQTPTPLLMLTSLQNAKTIQKLVDEYLETQIDDSAIERPASIVIMNKPIGPIKLTQCLRECFTPAFSNPNLQTPQGSPRVSPSFASIRVPPMPLVRSATVPHITTTTLGVHDHRLLSAGAMIKQSFVFPMMTQGGEYYDHRMPMVLIPAHSPGGLVLPPRAQNVSGPSPMGTPEKESCPTHHHHKADPGDRLEALHSRPVTPPFLDKATGPASNESVSYAQFRANMDMTVPKLKPQRSIKNYKSQKKASSPAAAGAAAGLTARPAVSSTLVDNNSPSSKTDIGFENSDKPMPRVLIVEDNITNRMILRTFLKKRGIGVVEAENGKLGVEHFQEEVWRRGGKAGFEFVLMDLQMPVMDGNIATKRIREFEQSMARQHEMSTPNRDGAPLDGEQEADTERGYRPTIIFALTGLAGDEDKRLAFECGVDGYLAKPVSLKTLESLMYNCLPTTANVEGLTSPADLRPQ
ncbi:His Kinase A domain containing protein, partial [Dissophora ornata]